MADFCLSCTRYDGLPGNDFEGWLHGVDGWSWGLCEGCGKHLFNDAGQPLCTEHSQLSPAGGLEGCPLCLEAYVALVRNNP